MIYIYLLFLFLFTIFFVLYTISLVNNIFYGVPQISTFNSDLDVLKKVFDKYLVKGKKIVDLGSGTGKMLRLFSRDYKMKAFGYEIDFSNYLIAKILNKIYKTNTIFFRKNYFKADLSQYDFIYTYLFPSLMEKIEDKIWISAKPGTIIIVNAFAFKNHKPIDIFNKKGKGKIYIYKV